MVIGLTLKMAASLKKSNERTPEAKPKVEIVQQEQIGVEQLLDVNSGAEVRTNQQGEDVNMSAEGEGSIEIIELSDKVIGDLIDANSQADKANDVPENSPTSSNKAITMNGIERQNGLTSKGTEMSTTEPGVGSSFPPKLRKLIRDADVRVNREYLS